MPGERWNRIEEIFHAALERSGQARDDFVRERCGDDDGLHDEVVSLLAADGPLDIDHPSTRTVGAALAGATSGLSAGSTLGPWTVTGLIAEGGMGSVWEAQRSDGAFDQTVAIKVIRAAVVDEALLDRFARERHALARLSHPHIARLLDGGATDQGLPYLVLERIVGLPIDAYCRDHDLPIDARVDLVREVSSAVHYAHQNLIVHRDLKPSNLLVDSGGRPVLLDFGIAKVLDPDLDPRRAGLTATGVRLMTPEYASPEQVRGEPATTATDVFALGVLLYELITGCRPHDRDGSSVREIEQAICDDPPLRPSVALRKSSPADTRRIPADLDTIVLKALQKEPARRYASAQQLADDLQRYRTGRPIAARPDSWTYRFGKLVRRHRWETVALTTLLVTLAAGIAGTIRAARLDQARLTDILRLSDLTRLTVYERRAEELWPAVPAKAAEMAAWLDDARELAGRLPRHRATLATLRARALPYDEDDAERDRRTHPMADELSALEVQREARTFLVDRGGPDQLADPEGLADLEQRLAALEAEVSERRTWEYVDPSDSWQDGELGRLVHGLQAFAHEPDGALMDVQRRLTLATSIREQSVEAHADAWTACCRDIADVGSCPAYGGLEVTPQLGLAPLGRDVDSGLWEFAHVASGRIPERDVERRLMITGETALVLVLIPGGTFELGSRRPEPGEAGDMPHVDSRARPDEEPIRSIRLAPFFLAKHEMTQGQWRRATGDNPSEFSPGQWHGGIQLDESHPVESVTWEEAEQVLFRQGLRLPTEAQWEYATRAGTTTPWWTGVERETLSGAVNMADETARRNNASWPGIGSWPGYDDGFVVHAPVHSLRANAFGLHHVHGNVWEWCLDDFGTYALPVSDGDGRRRLAGTPNRVGRGGSYINGEVSVRSSHRGHAPTRVRDKSIGLRPARLLVP